MDNTFPKKPFYFLRHAETDHNRYCVYDDVTEIAINSNGVMQALRVKEKLAPLPLMTVCSSPLLRVQQTLELALKDRNYYHMVIEDLKECEGDLWRLFLALEVRDLNDEEWTKINRFTHRIKTGVEIALKNETPLLIVAHGGTYWALAHFLKIQGDRKINNCNLIHFLPQEDGSWKTQPI